MGVVGIGIETPFSAFDLPHGPDQQVAEPRLVDGRGPALLGELDPALAVQPDDAGVIAEDDGVDLVQSASIVGFQGRDPLDVRVHAVAGDLGQRDAALDLDVFGQEAELLDGVGADRVPVLRG